MIIEKTIKLSEQADSHHIAIIEKYQNSSLANLLDSDIKDLMFSGKAWKKGLSDEELLQISLAIASLECNLKSKSSKSWWINQKDFHGIDPKLINKTTLDVIKFLIEGAKARRKELDEVNSIFMQMWRNLK